MKKYLIIAAVLILIIYLIKKFKTTSDEQSALDSADSGLAKEPHVNIMQTEKLADDLNVIDANNSYTIDRLKAKVIAALLVKMQNGTATLDDKKQLKELLK